MLVKKNYILMMLVIAILSIIFITSSCIKNGIKYVELKERIPHNITGAVLHFPDEDELFERSDLIFRGKIIDKKEIGLKEYIDWRLNHIYYRDIYALEIAEIYYTQDTSINTGDTVTVANASCSNDWIEGTIEMEKNKEYILLTKESEDTSTVEFTKYYEFAVLHPWMAIIIIDNKDYLFDEVFTSLISGAKDEIIKEDGDFETMVYVKGEEFEDELEDLILEYKGES